MHNVQVPEAERIKHGTPGAWRLAMALGPRTNAKPKNRGKRASGSRGGSAAAGGSAGVGEKRVRASKYTEDRSTPALRAKSRAIRAAMRRRRRRPPWRPRPW